MKLLCNQKSLYSDNTCQIRIFLFTQRDRIVKSITGFVFSLEERRLQELDRISEDRKTTCNSHVNAKSNTNSQNKRRWRKSCISIKRFSFCKPS